jgi:putative zinc finger/helix-turn-helix YgiT family protein
MTTSPKYICDNCGEVEAKETKIKKRLESYPVKGYPFEVMARVRVCARCGDPLYDRFLDSLNQQAAFEIYREKHHVISPSQIKTMRESYGLSQRGLGTLLGWGEITIHRYENGSLPDDSHNQVLQFIREPLNMKRIVDENGDRLRPLVTQKLKARVLSMISTLQQAELAKAWGFLQAIVSITHKAVAQTSPVYRLRFVTKRLSSQKEATNASHLDPSFKPLADWQASAKSLAEFTNV